MIVEKADGSQLIIDTFGPETLDDAREAITELGATNGLELLILAGLTPEAAKAELARLAPFVRPKDEGPYR